jgi:hypothetical protein
MQIHLLKRLGNLPHVEQLQPAHHLHEGYNERQQGILVVAPAISLGGRTAGPVATVFGPSRSFAKFFAKISSIFSAAKGTKYIFLKRSSTRLCGDGGLLVRLRERSHVSPKIVLSFIV